MLVLARKNGESIVIGGDITIQVIEVKGQAVRLGIEAPKETPIHRSELYDRIRENDTTSAPSNRMLDQKRIGLHDAVANLRRGRTVERIAADADVVFSRLTQRRSRLDQGFQTSSR